MEFKLHSEYQPTGDQPQAIEALVKGFKEGSQFETLLGVTGSGKTFTMANVIQQYKSQPSSSPTTKLSPPSSIPSLRSSSRRTRWSILSPTTKNKTNHY